MAKQSSAQRKTVGRVMHEFKHGELKRGRGRKVKNRRQAVAIALSEAGSSRYQSSAKNRQRLAQTKAKERRGRTAQQEKEGRMGASRDRRRSATSRRKTGAAATRRTASATTRRGNGPTRAELYQRARRKGIPGAARMRKAELERALRR
jgi:hypothetical protein